MNARRQCYTAAEKLTVAEYAEVHGNREASRHFGGINEANIRLWRNQKELLKLLPQDKKANRGAAPSFPLLEKKLMEWVVDKQRQGSGVSCVEIRLKAVQLAKSFEGTREFKASYGWAARFMEQHGLSVRRRRKIKQQHPVIESDMSNDFAEMVCGIKPQDKSRDICEVILSSPSLSDSTQSEANSSSVPFRTRDPKDLVITKMALLPPSLGKLAQHEVNSTIDLSVPTSSTDVVFSVDLTLPSPSEDPAQSEAFPSNLLLPTILDGSIFTIIEMNGKNVSAVCKFCEKAIHGSINATSNFTTHLKRLHPCELAAYNERKKSVWRKRSALLSPLELHSPNGKQPTVDSISPGHSSWSEARVNELITEFIESGVRSAEKSPSPTESGRARSYSTHKAYNDKRKSIVSPNSKHYKLHFTSPSCNSFAKDARVNRLITKYIMSSMSSLATVECKAFKELIFGLCSGVSTLSAKTMSCKILKELLTLRNGIIKRLTTAQFICVTADVWTATRRRSYVGVTAHWIEADFTRKSAIIACKRLPSPHSSDKTAALLVKVFEDFCLDASKVAGVVTGSRDDFTKAFKEFQTAGGMDFSSSSLAEDEDNEEKDKAEAEVSLVNLSDAVDQIRESEAGKAFLQHRFLCATQTLSLVATKDFLKVDDLTMFHSTFAKCSTLWNLSCSLKWMEIIVTTCGKQLVAPSVSCWKSVSDSVSKILEVKDSFSALSERLKFDTFDESKVTFLEEYKMVMATVAAALDRVQGESDVFLGDLLPTILRIRTALSSYASSSDLKFMKPFASAMLSGLECRYSQLLSLDQKDAIVYILASVSHPYFKLRWVPAEQAEAVKNLFIKETIALFADVVPETSSENSREHFFSFKSTTIQPPSPSALVLAECQKYFDDQQTNLTMLNCYPFVRKMFFKFNTVLPSSVAMDHLFSNAGILGSAKNSTLSDKYFEALVLINCNKVIM